MLSASQVLFSDEHSSMGKTQNVLVSYSSEYYHTIANAHLIDLKNIHLLYIPAITGPSLAIGVAE
jgi:hypothetical protein